MFYVYIDIRIYFYDILSDITIQNYETFHVPHLNPTQREDNK